MQLGAVVLDSDDSETLSDFYQAFLRWEKIKPDEEWIIVYDQEKEGTALVFQETPDYERPVWPAEQHKQQQMLHLDFYVKPDAFHSTVQHALQCGAKKSSIQFSDDWVVMKDPAGHPFCIIPFVRPE